MTDMPPAKREFFATLYAAISPAEKRPTELPEGTATFTSATEGVIKLLLVEAGEPKSADEKKLEALGVERAAHLGDCKGFSHDDALKNNRQHRADFRSGKRKDVPPGKAELIRQHSEIRSMKKQAGVAVSEQGCEIAAQIYERALPFVPALRKRIVTQEQAIFGDTAALGKSPLLRMVDDLPRTLKARIEKLRLPGRNCNPATLIPKI